MSLRFPLPESKERQGKHITGELGGLQAPQTDSSSGFHDFLKLKAACFEACYIQHSFCCIYLHCIFSIHKSGWAAPQVFAKPSQYLLCSKNPNGSRQWSSAWPKHSRHQLKQHPGQVTQFQIPKNYLLVESSQTQEENTKSTVEDLVSQQEEKESIWLISITLSLKQPHRNRAGHEFSVRRIVQAHQILKTTADVCSPF